MVTNRRGAGTMGCLFTLLMIAAAGYFAIKIGEVYWHYHEFQGTMQEQAKVADKFSDDQIRKRLVAKADSLGLPPEALLVTVERKGRHISIAADYTELVELPLHVRAFTFAPRAEHDY
jgi:hypothetical protein